MPKYNWTRVLYPNGGYGYVKTDNNDLAIEYKRDGTFKVYSLPNEKSHSFFTSFETRPRTIQRVPDDHEAHLALQRQVDEKVRQTTPSAGQLFNVATVGGLNNLSPTQWMRRAYDTGQLIQGYMPLNEYMNKLYYGNNGIVSDEYARKHPYRAMAVNLAGDIATFGAASTLRKMPNWYRIMLAENQAVQNTVANNWKNVGISGKTVDMRKPENWMSHHWDEAQDAAIARGDMTEAQRLRDLHADVKGYNSSLPLYHGSPEKNITAFDPNAKAGTLEGSGGTTFFTPNFEAADTYAKGKGVFEMTHDPGKVYKVYSAHKNPKIIDYDGASYRGTGTKLTMNAGDGIMRRILNPKGGGHFLDDYTVYTYDKLPIEGLEYPRYYAPPRNKHIVWEKEKVAGSTSEEAAKAMSEGYDVAILKNVDEGVGPNSAKIGPIDDYAIRDPRLIKSADAVTYNDNGVRIPLSLRDDFTSNDIRGRVINTYNHPEQFIHPAEAVRPGRQYVRPSVGRGSITTSEPLMELNITPTSISKIFERERWNRFRNPKYVTKRDLEILESHFPEYKRILELGMDEGTYMIVSKDSPLAKSSTPTEDGKLLYSGDEGTWILSKSKDFLSKSKNQKTEIGFKGGTDLKEVEGVAEAHAPETFPLLENGVFFAGPRGYADTYNRGQESPGFWLFFRNPYDMLTGGKRAFPLEDNTVRFTRGVMSSPSYKGGELPLLTYNTINKAWNADYLNNPEIMEFLSRNPMEMSPSELIKRDNLLRTIRQGLLSENEVKFNKGVESLIKSGKLHPLRSQYYDGFIGRDHALGWSPRKDFKWPFGSNPETYVIFKPEYAKLLVGNNGAFSDLPAYSRKKGGKLNRLIKK